MTIGDIQIPAGSTLRQQEDRELSHEGEKDNEKDPFDLRRETAPLLLRLLRVHSKSQTLKTSTLNRF
jgi:hypothetical protein